jgi:hypothetical protein
LTCGTAAEEFMPQPPKDKPVWETKPPDVLDMIYNVAIVYAGVVTPVIHSGFGVKAPAPYIVTFFLMYAFCGFGRCPQFLLYIPVWLGFVAFLRVTLDKRAHPRYRGYPWLACLIPGVNTEFKGRIIEPWLVMALGIYLKTYSDALAVFIFGAGIALLVVLLIDQAVLAARKVALRAAKLEAQQWAELERGGDGWN